MPRSSLLLPLLVFITSAFSCPARAQRGTPPPLDPAAVLATLKDLRARQPAMVNREKANTLAALSAAIADPAKAYDQAMAAVDFQGGTGNDGARIAEWRKRQGDMLRNRDFINGLRLQLTYLALTWQHQMGAKPADQLGPLLEYTSQLTPPVLETLASFEPLRKPIGESVFVPYFQMGPFLSGMSEWSDRPFDVDSIYQKTILPEMRLEKDPRLLTYWDVRIHAGSARAEISKNALAINKFKAIELPALLWDRDEDEIALGRLNQGVADMLALVKAHADHPDFKKWASRLEELVSAQLAPPPPSLPPAALMAPVTPAPALVQ